MDRQPVRQPVIPAYPDRSRARAVALGLLALGGATLAASDLSGCVRRTAPAAPTALRCSGDQAAPAPADPEVSGAARGPVRGDMPAAEPEPAPVEHIDGEVAAPAPAPAPEEQVPVPGGMPVPQEPPPVPAPPAEDGGED